MRLQVGKTLEGRNGFFFLTKSELQLAHHCKGIGIFGQDVNGIRCDGQSALKVLAVDQIPCQRQTRGRVLGSKARGPCKKRADILVFVLLCRNVSQLDERRNVLGVDCKDRLQIARRLRQSVLLVEHLGAEIESGDTLGI